nr:hypothetical protein [Lapidilactobacillus mulanensis]
MYTSILSKFQRTDLPYSPHVTIGHVTDPTKLITCQQQLADFDQQLFTTTITEIALEEIGLDERSNIVQTFSLRRNPLF